jgi:hypothetical protein
MDPRLRGRDAIVTGLPEAFSSRHSTRRQDNGIGGQSLPDTA